MSSFLNLSLDTGPGSYDIQDSMGQLSLKHYNSPRPTIARAKKTNKQFFSPELNKQLSGLESPGVSIYNPNHLKLLESSPSAFFGTQKRTMSHITPLLDRSPGPVYSHHAPITNSGVTFAKSRRNSTITHLSPAPWDYNPKIPPTKLPSINFKSPADPLTDKISTPGPGTYTISSSLTKRGAYVSKVGRSFKFQTQYPGPGTYEQSSRKITSNSKFGGGKRNLDPRLYANSNEYYRNF